MDTVNHKKEALRLLASDEPDWSNYRRWSDGHLVNGEAIMIHALLAVLCELEKLNERFEHGLRSAATGGE